MKTTAAPPRYPRPTLSRPGTVTAIFAGWGPRISL
jgi:hypothetical protein